jgi:hypothetical protein
MIEFFGSHFLYLNHMFVTMSTYLKILLCDKIFLCRTKEYFTLFSYVPVEFHKIFPILNYC